MDADDNTVADVEDFVVRVSFAAEWCERRKNF
jgi:hypothetical protein